MAKTQLDMHKLDIAASRLRSIAHPMRIAIINLLEANGKMNVTAIYERLKMEQAAASHHLNILKSKGVLESKRDGKNTYYYLKHSALNTILDCITKCNE
jgi:ArsR family transcriptional regulator, virulence genes transcriptional regulator